MVELLLVLLAGVGKGLVGFGLVLGRDLRSSRLDLWWGRMAAVVKWRWRRVMMVVRMERRILAVGRLFVVVVVVVGVWCLGWWDG